MLDLAAESGEPPTFAQTPTRWAGLSTLWELMQVKVVQFNRH